MVAKLFLAFCLLISAEQIYSSDWKNFQNQHILDVIRPPNSKYETWSNSDWNEELKQKIGAKYGSKEVNSIMIGATTQIQQDFNNATDKYSSGSSRDNLYWGNEQYDIYVMTLIRKKSTYQTHRCGKQYVCAGVDKVKNPVHFQGYAKNKKESGQLPTNLKDCSKLK